MSQEPVPVVTTARPKRIDTLLIAILAIVAALLMMGQINPTELADKALEIILTATLTARGIIK